MAKKKSKSVMLPDNLTPEAKRFITAIINDLKEKDRLESTDTASLYILAKACNTYIRAHEHLDNPEEGLTFTSDRGNISVSPYVKIARDAEKCILALLQDYGCTLRSRQKLKEIDAEVEDSPLASFIKESMED